MEDIGRGGGVANNVPPIRCFERVGADRERTM